MREGQIAPALLDPDRPAPRGLIGAQSERRFAIYRNNVVSSLVETLSESFPATRALVGDEFFKAMAAEFARAHPPRSPIMMRWGGDLPRFIAEFPPAQSVVYLAGVAALEWARIESYHAADAAPLDAQALGRVAPEALETARLARHPATRLIRSDHPVVTLWSASTGQGGEPRLGVGECALISRPETAVAVRAAPPEQGVMLAALLAGAPLSEAAALGGDLSAALGLLFAAGAISDLHVETL